LEGARLRPVAAAAVVVVVVAAAGELAEVGFFRADARAGGEGEEGAAGAAAWAADAAGDAAAFFLFRVAAILAIADGGVWGERY
jgi:hypothetical protein